MTGPHLPPELECRIFEIAALVRPTGIPRLMLCRVKHWVEPLLYRVLVISSSPTRPIYGFPVIPVRTLLPVIEAKPPHFLQHAVKRIFVTGLVRKSQMETILAACSHAFDYYYCMWMLPCAEALAQLHHLHRLTIPLHGLLECLSIDSTHPVLANITHLDLHAIPNEQFTLEELYQSLCLVSKLTHFAVNFTVHDRGFHTAPLRANTHLECIVFLVNGGLAVDLQEVQDPIEHDARFVCIVRNNDRHMNWLRHSDTDRDFWALADAFIAARREGRVDRSRYILSDKETSWLD
ncbi:hypothetical protein C8R45DRAFT_1208751 [Mycena sanguinolenta]|nr:hypothetical protein C8R45DRAFT_1208751 [Mycena sanguinolenta]